MISSSSRADARHVTPNATDPIPVAQEPYDLVLRTSGLTDELLAPLWTLLGRAEFRAAVEALGGYSCTETGRRIRWAWADLAERRRPSTVRLAAVHGLLAGRTSGGRLRAEPASHRVNC